jgi:hypothetical protein
VDQGTRKVKDIALFLGTEALNSLSQKKKRGDREPGMVVYTYNSCTWEDEVGGSQV